jgi:hypothetical protein
MHDYHVAWPETQSTPSACAMCLIWWVPAAQVEGKHGMTVLKNKMAKGGVPVLYHGALAASGATFVGQNIHPPLLQSYHWLCYPDLKL